MNSIRHNTTAGPILESDPARGNRSRTMRRSSHAVTTSCAAGLKKHKPQILLSRTPALPALSHSTRSPPRRSAAAVSNTRALSVLSSLFPSSVDSASTSSLWMPGSAALSEGAPGLFQLPNLHKSQDFYRLASEVKTKCDALKHKVRPYKIRRCVHQSLWQCGSLCMRYANAWLTD